MHAQTEFVPLTQAYTSKELQGIKDGVPTINLQVGQI